MIVHGAYSRPERAIQHASAVAIVPSAVFAATLMWRTPGLFVDWRFWAEEGPLYYGACRICLP